MCYGASSHRSNSKAVGGDVMDESEIIKAAKAVGLNPYDMKASPRDAINSLQRFAALVAAKEREACALVCDAKAHEVRLWCNESNVIACAAAIRARGQKGGEL